MVPGHRLVNNPLNDPAERHLAVFLPTQYTTTKRLPVVYYLPGFGGSSDDFIAQASVWQGIVQHFADTVTPVIFVVVDGRTRWGGSQYINSPAQGAYADYICEDIVPLVDMRYATIRQTSGRIIAGHSSGGFGALRLGSSHSRLFGHVIALSPDSDFPTTHLSLVQDPAVRRVSQQTLQALIQPNPTRLPRLEGDVEYIVALSVAYAPRGADFPGQFDWPYDAKGQFQESVWRRWLDNDPLEIVRKRRNAFLPSQSIYLDGAAHDEFKANIGARKIGDVLQTRRCRSVFYEPPGGHGDHLPERIARGLAWTLDKPLSEIHE